MRYYLLLDENSYVKGTEESSGAPTADKTFAVPKAVYDEVRNNDTTRVYRVRCGDLECLPIETEIDVLRRDAVNSLVARMLDELATGILRVTDEGTYRFKHDDETVAQLSLFSESFGETDFRYVKALNINTGYYDAVKMFIMDIAALRAELANRWSDINHRYLTALNNVKTADRSVDIIRVCQQMEVKVL